LKGIAGDYSDRTEFDGLVLCWRNFAQMAAHEISGEADCEQDYEENEKSPPGTKFSVIEEDIVNRRTGC
jgi:hypothetical protein